VAAKAAMPLQALLSISASLSTDLYGRRVACRFTGSETFKRQATRLPYRFALKATFSRKREKG
jgi:hypothetical protein